MINTGNQSQIEPQGGRSEIVFDLSSLEGGEVMLPLEHNKTTARKMEVFRIGVALLCFSSSLVGPH